MTVRSSGAQEAALAQFAGGDEGRARFRRGKEPLLAGQRPHAFQHLLVGHGQGRAAALADRVQDQVVGDGRRARACPARWCAAFGQARGVAGSRPRTRLTMGAHPSACTTIIFGRAGPNQPHLLQLGKRLPHADDAGAAAGRVDDGVGHLASRVARRSPAPSSSCPRRGRARAGWRHRYQPKAAAPARITLPQSSIRPSTRSTSRAIGQALRLHGCRRVVRHGHHCLQARSRGIGGHRGGGIAG